MTSSDTPTRRRGQRTTWAAGLVVAAGAGVATAHGLSQAVYLAGGIGQSASAPVGLRFGVGAWPAIAAALTAHLLHLISTATDDPATAPTASVQPYNPPSVQPSIPDPVQPPRRVPALDAPAVQPERSAQAGATALARTPEPDRLALDGAEGGGSAPGDRARHAARAHLVRHGALPTATELMQTAQVSRGTAGTVLKQLRGERPTLHIVTASAESDTDH
jgi:hypothetical protein